MVADSFRLKEILKYIGMYFKFEEFIKVAAGLTVHRG